MGKGDCSNRATQDYTHYGEVFWAASVVNTTNFVGVEMHPVA